MALQNCHTRVRVIWKRPSDLKAWMGFRQAHLEICPAIYSPWQQKNFDFSHQLSLPEAGVPVPGPVTPPPPPPPPPLLDAH